MTAATAYHVVFAGGGTGGHLFPGIAVAESLAEELPGLRITFAGSAREFEREQVQQAGFDYLAVPGRPLPRRVSGIVPFLAEYWSGTRIARQFLLEQRVSAVVGLGGYASVSMGRAAAKLALPLVLMEQNVVPGRATRWLSRWATFLCAAMDETGGSWRPRCPVLVTGNPIRAAFTRRVRHRSDPLAAGGEAAGRARRKAATLGELLYYAPEGQRPAERTARVQPAAEPRATQQLLVLGGSGGARSLNEKVPRALARIRWALEGWRIVHQAGETHAQQTRQLYKMLKLDATVATFLPDMPSVLAQTDLAICRSGGTTLAELAAMAVPAVLIPYPHAAEDHQRKNAERYVASGGCLVLDERDEPGELIDRLADTLSYLVLNQYRYQAMSRAIGQLARPEAASEVAIFLAQLVASRAAA